jgi:hypothetical protein
MSSPKIAGRKTRLSGKRFARALLGFKARRADVINICVAGALKGGTHPAAPLGGGGMRNAGWQGRFKTARADCAAKYARKTPRPRKTPVA